MPHSKSGALFTRIRTDILTLQLPPDSPLRLPGLSDRYGTGLTPLRDCLYSLSGEELVIPQHNRGFRVAPLTRADLLDLERSRNAMEGAMLLRSLTLGGDDWEAGVVGSFHNLSQTPVPSILEDTDDLARWTQRHHAFHKALVGAETSPWMQRFTAQTGDQLGRYQLFIQQALRDLARGAPQIAGQAADVFSSAMALEPHKALFDAVLARDEARTKTAFDAHTQLTLSAFEGLAALMPSDTAFAKTLGTEPELAS